jgi:Family of unknown function (DUF6627)
MNVSKQGSAKSWMTALVAVVFTCLAGAATAEIVTTEQVLPQADRERVHEFLNREDVEDRLKQLGVTPAEARKRVDAMTPEEIRTVAGKMDTLAAGGALSTTDWIIILLLIIVVLLIV